MWYQKVFKNFDLDQDGLLSYFECMEIVMQYHEHHMERNKRRAARQESNASTAASFAPEISPSAMNNAPMMGPVSGDTTEADAKPHAEAKRTRGVDVGLNHSKRGSLGAMPDNVMFPRNTGRFEIFEAYEFFTMVGQGTFGKVMIVKHKTTGQVRACKSIQCRDRHGLRELIESEIQVLKKLNHPNILRLYETFHDNTNIYLVSEFCDGGTIFDRILHHYEKLRVPIGEEQVKHYMRQILSALQYCHSIHIIHRDIQPENILFVDRTPASPLKLIDFGLSAHISQVQETAKEIKVPRKGALGTLARLLPAMPNGKRIIPLHVRKNVMQRAGTPHYMAPEMVDGNYDEKADLFPTGLILCQLLTGIHPLFPNASEWGMDLPQLHERICQKGEIEYPSSVWGEVSPQARDLAQQLTRRAATRRPSAAEALQHRWLQQAGGSGDCLTVSVLDGLRCGKDTTSSNKRCCACLRRSSPKSRFRRFGESSWALTRTMTASSPLKS
jgi:calcium-dependent protein kinase